MRKYNINAILVCAIEHLYDNAISAVLMNGNTSEWVRAPVGVTELQKKRSDMAECYRTSHTRTISPMRLFTERFKQPLENMTNS